MIGRRRPSLHRVALAACRRRAAAEVFGQSRQVGQVGLGPATAEALAACRHRCPARRAWAGLAVRVRPVPAAGLVGHLAARLLDFVPGLGCLVEA